MGQWLNEVWILRIEIDVTEVVEKELKRGIKLPKMDVCERCCETITSRAWANHGVGTKAKLAQGATGGERRGVAIVEAN